MSDFELRHFINGVEFKPVNYKSIKIKGDWTGNPKEAEISVSNIVLGTEAKSIVNGWIDQYGVFQGIPYKIQIGTLTLDYVFDLHEPATKIAENGEAYLEITVYRKRDADWLTKEMRNLTFEALNKTHPISTIDIPYIIVRDNQAEMLIMLLISAYTLTKALIEAIEDLVQAISETIEAATPNAGVPPSYNTGAIITAVLKAVARAVYVAAIVIALIELTQQIIELIFPPVRKLKAARINELLTKVCEKYGFQFQSSLLQSGDYAGLTFLGVPLKKNISQSLGDIFTNLFTIDNGSYTKGYPTSRDTTSRALQLFEAMEGLFNAERRVVGNTVYLEGDNFWQANANVSITRTLNLQDRLENQHQFNTEDWWKRYLIQFQYDTTDTHTMNNLDTADCEYSTEFVSSPDPDLFTIEGFATVNVPFAYGIRKPSLNEIEEAAIPFAELADEVINFFGGDSDLAGSIQGRVGIMQISQQYYSTSKLLLCTANGKQGPDYLFKLAANTFYQQFHTSNQVKENFKQIEEETVKFSTSMLENLLTNNYITDQAGNSLEVLTFEWLNETKNADIKFAEPSDEGDNTKTILIDG